MPLECCKETWEKFPEDEPVFIIRGKDLLATGIIKEWINSAKQNNVNQDKINRVKQHLKAIEEFQKTNPDRCKIPD